MFRSAIDQLRRWLTLIILLLILSFTVLSHTVGFVADLTSRAIFAATGIVTASAEYKVKADLETRRAHQLDTDYADLRYRTATLEIDLREERTLAANLREEKRLMESFMSGVDLRVTSLEANLGQERVLTNNLRRELAERTAATTIMFRGRRIDIKDATNMTVERIRSRTRRVATANAAAVFGESIPFYGIGIIVATTGFEIAMQCETMKDLYDLQVAIDPESAIAEDRDIVCGLQVPTAEELWASLKGSPSQVWENATGLFADISEIEIERPDFSDQWSRTVNWFDGWC